METQAVQRGFQGSFRQSMSWLHTWAGLTLSVLLYFMFVTGSAGYFNTEIDRWMQPELPVAGAVTVPQSRMLEHGLARLAEMAPAGAKDWSVAFPNGRRDPYLSIYAAPQDTGAKPFGGQLDPATGQPFPAARKTGGGAALYSMHYALHYLPYDAAIYLVGIATMFMLVAIVSGVIVHRKIFADFYTFRPGKGQRSWLDAHNLSSVMALPFFVMITCSGLVFYAYEYMPSVKAAVYGTGEEAQRRFESERGEASESYYATRPAGRTAAPAPIEPMLAQASVRWGEGALRDVAIINPGDASARVRLGRRPQGDVHPRYESLWFDGVSGTLLFDEQPVGSAPETFSSVIIALHEGHFAPPLLRWLYFASGLLGAAMIATGLVLWTTKRRQALKRDELPDAGLRFVEHFNVGIVAGLPIAVAAYFWANRLIPSQMPGRDDWEMHALFIVWALALLHAALRPASRAWIEQFAAATALYALLPLLNAATTDVHLGRTLAAGDGVRAGFDLTMLALAGTFGWLTWRLRRPRSAARAGARESIDRQHA